MHHFEQSFYYVLKQLNKASLINSAKVCAPKMMCKDERQDDTDENNNHNAPIKESWEDFLPSIAVPFWPKEATEWYLRKRKAQRLTFNQCTRIVCFLTLKSFLLLQISKIISQS